MDKRYVEEAIISHISDALAVKGFKYVKSYECFLRKTKVGLHKFIVGAYPISSYVRLEPIVAIRIHEVMDIFNRTSEINAKYHKHHNTIITQIYKLEEKPETCRFDITSSDMLENIGTRTDWNLRIHCDSIF